MKLNPLIVEPALEFANGSHVCPRAGIAEHHVYDAQFSARRDKILIGGVGTSESLEKLAAWFERVAGYIPAKPGAKQPTLFPPFIGFNKGGGFRSELTFDGEIARYLKPSEISETLKIGDHNEMVSAAVNLYYRQVKFLAQNRNVDVIVCVLPDDFFEAVSNEPPRPDDEDTKDGGGQEETNFRRLLKARCMHLGRPLQITREVTLGAGDAGQQDDATRAWNFCTALYYKANQTVPWKLQPNVNRPSVCFAGIGFYRSRDRKVLHTSLAQVFDELGNSVILRGTPVDVNKDDRRPYLSEEQAHDLLAQALYEYEVAMEHSPARLVIHKSSNYREGEVIGMRAAAEKMRVGSVDFVTVLNADFRLFRDGSYPPYRGTHVEFDRDHHLLYTRGAVPYYKTYPGNYVPRPLDVRLVECDESSTVICKEILSLTKMNWNNTQFDGKYPINLRCARKVGEIMKYLKPDDQPQIGYSFYM